MNDTSAAPARGPGTRTCPAWCVTDHERYDFHGSPRSRVEVPGKISGVQDLIQTRAIRLDDLDDGDGGTRIAASGVRHGTSGNGPQLWVRPGDAEDLAGLIEMLAAATPERHRDLAAAIRKAAADIADPEAWIYQ